MDEVNRRIRLILLHDHGLFRASLARLLASEQGFEVAAECETFSEALEALSGLAVDIVLLDFDLGTKCAGDFITAARGAGYRGHFLIVATAPDAKSAATVLKLGASGIFLKSEVPDRLVRAIRLVANGDTWIDLKIIQTLADQVIDRFAQNGKRMVAEALEEREHNVLLGVLGGLTNKKIGGGMGLSESSVKNVIQRLFGKAGVRKRSELVRVTLDGSWGIERIDKSRVDQPIK